MGRNRDEAQAGKDQRGGGDGEGTDTTTAAGRRPVGLVAEVPRRNCAALHHRRETAGKAAGQALEGGSSASSRRRQAQVRSEALEFARLAFSLSGKYLAALASPTGMPQQKQLTIYELQDSRHSLVPSRSLSFNDGETVLGLEWLVDNSLLVFVASIDGEARVHSVAPASALGPASWPPVGTRLPGALVGAAASAQGLIALAFGTEEGKGKLVILTCPGMKIACELPLDGRPQSIQLYQPKGSCLAYLSSPSRRRRRRSCHQGRARQHRVERRRRRRGGGGGGGDQLKSSVDDLRARKGECGERPKTRERGGERGRREREEEE